MLDVVFILLIFFIVTAVFIQESAIDLETPPKDGTGQAHPEASNKIVLRIRDQLASARVDSVNLVLSDV